MRKTYLYFVLSWLIFILMITASCNKTSKEIAIVRVLQESGDAATGDAATGDAATGDVLHFDGLQFTEAFPGLPEFPRPLALFEIPNNSGWMLLILQGGQLITFPKNGPWTEVYTAHDQINRTKPKEGSAWNEEGLLSLAFAPDFEDSGIIYTYYSPANNPSRTVLARLKTTGVGADFLVDETSEKILLSIPQPYPNHNGGTLLFGPDGHLFLGIGDGGASGDPHNNGQDIWSLLGTISRLDVSNSGDYRIPKSNPFADGLNGLPEIWAWGLRNPWRMNFDAKGNLWVGDVGQNRIEEINIVQQGKNYGWNTMEGSLCFNPELNCVTEKLILPIYEYDHSKGCAVTGGYIYRGDAIQELKGWYVFADWCGKIWAFPTKNLSTNTPILPVVLREKGRGIVSLAEDRAGELYFLSFTDSFQIRKLVHQLEQ
jgi:glucose/arabinose dehydrogenase